ncbi:hypothetical protein MHYP_G00082090 [Metynnis hypsauchen]
MEELCEQRAATAADSRISAVNVKRSRFRRVLSVESSELLLLLRTEEDRQAAKATRMKQHLGVPRAKTQTNSLMVEEHATGFYEFNRMPQGVTNAPSTIQRLMERCMGSLNLKEVLSSVRYLGHIVSSKGVETDPEKVSALRSWPRPQTLSQLKSFLGFAGYYRRFVKDYSKIVKPLNDLTKGYPPYRKGRKATSCPVGYFNPKTPFSDRWTPACQEAFEAIIIKLTSSPVLGFANPKLPYVLHTDASTSGLGAALYQEQDGEMRVIAYASRGLSPSKKRYPAHKLEFLALKWSITEKFQDYLYVPDENAIGMSTIPTFSEAELQQYQRSDLVIGHIINLLENGEANPNLSPHSWELKLMSKELKRLQLRNGLLYRTCQSENDITYHLVVPKSLRSTILTCLHDDMGHMGLERTLDLVRTRFIGLRWLLM